MTTNETPEQFRARIAEIGFDGARLTEPDWLSVKIAVYTQALRDVMAGYGDWRYAADSLTLEDSLVMWAYDALGIDLTEIEAQ